MTFETIDDSALFHGTYDPVKAREYYLRTRKLKGRKNGSAPEPTPREGGSSKSSGGHKSRANTKSRRAELKAQKAALEKRLDHLREVLEQKVKAAKALSAKNAPAAHLTSKGTPKSSSSSSTKAPETKADVADRNTDEKSKKLTSAQKSKKNKAAKEKYEKDHPNSLSDDVDILRLQVKDIQDRIRAAVKDAQQSQPHKAGKSPNKVRSKHSHDGPRGR